MANSEGQYSRKRKIISFYIDLNISPERSTDKREPLSGPLVHADVSTRKQPLIDLNISPERIEDEATSLRPSVRADIASSSNCKGKEKETSSKPDDTGVYIPFAAALKSDVVTGPKANLCCQAETVASTLSSGAATDNDVTETRQKEGDSVLKGERKSRNARKRADDFGRNEKQICNVSDDDDDVQILCQVKCSHARKYVKIGENAEIEYTLKNNVDVLQFINEKHKVDGVSTDRSVSAYVAESESEDEEEDSCNSPDSGFLIACKEDHSDDVTSTHVSDTGGPSMQSRPKRVITKPARFRD